MVWVGIAAAASRIRRSGWVTMMIGPPSAGWRRTAPPGGSHHEQQLTHGPANWNIARR